MSDWRTVLGHQEGNTRNAVAAKYRKLMLKYHPNKSGTQNTREQFAKVREAWKAAQAHFQSPPPAPTPSFQRPSPTPMQRPSPSFQRPSPTPMQRPSPSFQRPSRPSPTPVRRPSPTPYSFSYGSIPYARTRVGRPSPSAYYRPSPSAYFRPSPTFAQSPPPSPRTFASRFRRWLSRSPFYRRRSYY